MTNDRLARARQILVDQNLDALVVSNPHSRRYLTGHTGHDHPPDESGGVALITRELAELHISKNNTEWAAAEAPDFTVRGWSIPWAIGIIEQLKDVGALRIGIEDEALSVRDFNRLVERSAADQEWIPLANAVERLRLVKDREEIALIAKACALTDAALLEALGTLKEGDSELTFARSLDDAMRQLGADGPGFTTIVASGPNAARPHHAAGSRPISAGEPVVIDMGAELHGYRADLTRTICLGTPSKELQTVYNVVLEAQLAALRASRAGATGKDVDNAARSVIGAAGYGDEFVHGLGHGVGLRIHEGPSASPRSNDTLQAGMTLTIEPGIYIPGWGGVRIEDFVVIEVDGCLNLTTAPKRLAISETLSGEVS